MFILFRTFHNATVRAIHFEAGGLFHLIRALHSAAVGFHARYFCQEPHGGATILLHAPYRMPTECLFFFVFVWEGAWGTEEPRKHELRNSNRSSFSSSNISDTADIDVWALQVILLRLLLNGLIAIVSKT